MPSTGATARMAASLSFLFLASLGRAPSIGVAAVLRLQLLAMKIEHVAYMYQRPAEVAEWYVKHLGFKIVRAMDKAPFTHFIADETGKVMVEIYNNPVAPILDYSKMHAVQLHLAFVSADPKADRDRLVKAGCKVSADSVITPDGDELVMLQDPWGFYIQMCKRAKPMV